MEKKLMDTTEATGDLIGNKIADKITSLGKLKNKQKEKEKKKMKKMKQKRFIFHQKRDNKSQMT